MNVESAVASIDNALQCSIPELENSAQALAAYTAVVAQQHRVLSDRIAELCDNSLCDCVDGLDRLADSTDALEAAFAQIDALEASMDAVHALLLSLNQTIKAIDTPSDATERAATFLKSTFGFASKLLKERTAGQQWNRIPNHCMINGLCPSDFCDKVRQLTAKLGRYGEDA